MARTASLAELAPAREPAHEAPTLGLVNGILKALDQHVHELEPGSWALPPSLTEAQQNVLLGFSAEAALSLREIAARRYLQAAQRRENLRELLTEAAAEAQRQHRTFSYIESLMAAHSR